MFRHDSDKVVFAEKRHSDSTAHLCGGTLLDNAQARDRSLVVGEGSKTHFPQRYSETTERKTIKQFQHKESGRVEDLPWGKRRIECPKTDILVGGAVKTYFRRHIDPSPSEQSDKITVDWTSRNIPLDKTGKARNQVRSDEYKLSDVLTRKRSVVLERYVSNHLPNLYFTAQHFIFRHFY